MNSSIFATSSILVAGAAMGSPAILNTKWPGDSSLVATTSAAEILHQSREAVLACVPEGGEILARVTGLTPFSSDPFKNCEACHIGITIAEVPFDVRFINQFKFLLNGKIALEEKPFWDIMAEQFMVGKNEMFFIRVQRRQGAYSNFFHLSSTTRNVIRKMIIGRGPVPRDSQLWCSDAEREEAMEALRVQVS